MGLVGCGFPLGWVDPDRLWLTICVPEGFKGRADQKRPRAQDAQGLVLQFWVLQLEACISEKLQWGMGQWLNQCGSPFFTFCQQMMVSTCDAASNASLPALSICNMVYETILGCIMSLGWRKHL